MTDLYLVRHAHAGNPTNWPGDDDIRPLTAKGLRQATRLGEFLRIAALTPGRIVTSPKARALQTAEVLGAALGCDVRLDARLAFGPSIDDLRAIVAEAGGESPLILVGHDPHFSDIAGLLTGGTLALRKGSLVRVELDGEAIVPGSGRLRWLIPPDALGR